MLKSFSDFILESKQVGTIYHFTTILSLVKIFDDGFLGDKSLGKYATVSFTRDKNFDKRTKLVPTECRISFDGDKLSNKYKIKPYQFHAGEFTGKKWKKEYQIEDQMEEVLYGGVKYPFSYIQEIIIKEVDLWDKVYDEEFILEYSKITNTSPEDFNFYSIPQWLKGHGHKIKILVQ